MHKLASRFHLTQAFTVLQHGKRPRNDSSRLLGLLLIFRATGVKQ
jgi:hypothetical protein